MNCKRADELMMKFMDGTITEKEALALRDHVGECSNCYEDFLAYNEILDEFADFTPVINAPEAFTENVMLKINTLEEAYLPKETKLDTILYSIWGAISVLCGLGMLLIFNKESLIKYFNASPIFNSYVKYFEPVEIYITEFKLNALEIINSAISWVASYFESFRLVAIISLVILALAQVITSRKKKVEIQ